MKIVLTPFDIELIIIEHFAENAQIKGYVLNTAFSFEGHNSDIPIAEVEFTVYDDEAES